MAVKSRQYLLKVNGDPEYQSFVLMIWKYRKVPNHVTTLVVPLSSVVYLSISLLSIDLHESRESIKHDGKTLTVHSASASRTPTNKQ
jgi:hypothetical protein